MSDDLQNPRDPYYLDIPNTDRLYLIYTLKCNFSCSHCLVNSSPDRHEKMSLSTAVKIVQAAADCDYRVVYITGGEVFLYYKELIDLVQFIHSLDLKCVVETNAFWAVDDRRANSLLARLVDVGLGCIAVSVDKYHLEFGRLDAIVRVARAARSIGVACRILVVASTDNQVDREILRRLDEEGFPYFYETLLAIGRARELEGTIRILQNGKCDSIGVTVLPNGEAVSCSGAFSKDRPLVNSPLYVGNLAHGNVRTLLQSERSNPFARTIDQYGHEGLTKMLPSAMIGSAPKDDAFPSLCDYCHALLGNHDRVRILRERLRGIA